MSVNLRARAPFLVFLIVFVIVIFALTGNTYVCCAREELGNDIEKVSLRFLEEVVDIRLNAYNLTEYRCVTAAPLIQGYLRPGHVETWVDITLSRESDELQVELRFMDGEFYYFRLNEGTPITNTEKTTNLLNYARTVLERYRLQFNAMHCAQLAPMLDQITNLDHEQTIERDEAVLEIHVTDKDTSFRWTPKIDGIKMQKDMSIRIDRNGFLRKLWDWCGILSIGSTEINVSREEAINIAFGVAQKHADEIGAKIGGYETQLMLYNDAETGRGDCFTLYPRWLVTVNYDKAYGGYDGYYACIWADTGEVYREHAQGFIGSQTTNPPNPWTIILLASALIAVPAVLVLYRKRKRSGLDVRNRRMQPE